MLESTFQKKFLDKIRELYPDATILKNDATYIQGFPDWTILFLDGWAVLEIKQSLNAPKQPNQQYYITMLGKTGYARFVYPENEEEILNEIQFIFKPGRKA